MFYKRKDMIKYSVFMAGAFCVFGNVAFAQNTVDLLGNEAVTAETAKDNQLDELGLDKEKASAASKNEQDVKAVNPEKEVSENIDVVSEKKENEPDLNDKDTLGKIEAKAIEAKDETDDLLVEKDILADENLESFDNIPLSDKTKSATIEPEPDKESDNSVIKAYNNFVDQQDLEIMNKNETKEDVTLGDKIMSQVKEDLFSQMADIEKQTGLLTLELKREKIKNEIAAMKAQRERAEEEELEKQQEKERKQAEWEKEQERKTLVEQQKLKDLEVKYERLRQERVLKAYKESMLKSNQGWVEYNAKLYNQLINEEKIQSDILKKQKQYFSDLSALVTKANASAKQAKDKYNKDVANLQTQIAILKSKLEAIQAERNVAASTQANAKASAGAPNPFALASSSTNKELTKKLPEEYAIMEISGKGDKLIAKLINKNGGTFMVKPGTVLNTGHVIEEITQTYITADRGGIKDYLYFSAGGILDKEPTKPINAALKVGVPGGADAKGTPAAPTTSRIPSLREGMFVE